METIRVALADDQLLFRRGLVSLLNSISGIEVLFEASNGQELIATISNTEVRPHVLILDLNMPLMNGIEATKYIRKNYPGIRIIILSVHNDERFIVHMLELDVSGYLFKDCEPSELEDAIRTVMQDDFYMNEQVIKAMRKGLTGKKEKVSLDAQQGLTAREREILDLICREYTAAEIADKLSISARTVEGHRNNLMHKTGTRNVAGLVVYAMKNNLTDAGF